MQEARRLYTLSMDQGDLEARNLLAKMHHDGEGGPIDMTEARRLYRLSAEEEDPIAQRNLAVLYYNGLGGAKDLKEAHRFFAMAAAQGDEFALEKVKIVEGALVRNAMQDCGLGAPLLCGLDEAGPSYEDTLD